MKQASGREHHETELNSKKGGGEGVYVMRRVDDRPKPVRAIEKAFRFWGGQGLRTPH